MRKASLRAVSVVRSAYVASIAATMAFEKLSMTKLLTEPPVR